MKTLTVTAARQNLGAWLKKTLQGEDIGVMIDGAIVAFRPVKVYSAALKKLSDDDVTRVEEALRLLPACFGQPHIHAGISIRRIRKNVFECRAGLRVHLLFRGNAQALEVFFVGNHDHLRRLIRHL